MEHTFSSSFFLCVDIDSVTAKHLFVAKPYVTYNDIKHDGDNDKAYDVDIIQISHLTGTHAVMVELVRKDTVVLDKACRKLA